MSDIVAVDISLTMRASSLEDGDFCRFRVSFDSMETESEPLLELGNGQDNQALYSTTVTFAAADADAWDNIYLIFAADVNNRNDRCFLDDVSVVASVLPEQPTTSTSPVPSLEPYQAVGFGCDGSTYCHIQSIEDCEAAAVYLDLPDTTSNTDNSETRSPGCATNNLGNLRYNSFLDTGLQLGTQNGKVVLCALCE